MRWRDEMARLRWRDAGGGMASSAEATEALGYCRASLRDASGCGRVCAPAAAWGRGCIGGIRLFASVISIL